MWAHGYLVVAHHLAYLACRASFCIQDKYIYSEERNRIAIVGRKKRKTQTNKQNPRLCRGWNQTCCWKKKLGQFWGSLQAYAGTWAVSVCTPVWQRERERAGVSEREEALKLKLLLQLCICSESLVWLTLTVFTLASVQMEQLWQEKKQVMLLITCCSRQLRQDFFLRAQMKQRRVYWAPLWLLLFS